MGRVAGKVALVTGAARGMGAAHARRLVEEGARVMLTDILAEELARTAAELGENAAFLVHDVTSAAEWDAAVAATETTFGPISILVNNAGILGKVGKLTDLPEADFRKVIDVNLVSVFLGTKAVVGSMRRAGGGSIINISSIGGLVGAPGAAAYISAKFAVRGLTKTAAIDLAPDRIRVNSIHPGWIDTEMTKPEAGHEEAVKAAMALTLPGRAGRPEEVANVMLMLASDEAAFMTGSELVIDGGMTCQ